MLEKIIKYINSNFGIRYKYTKCGYEVIGRRWFNRNSNLIIPDNHFGKKVVSVQECAFCGNQYLKELTLGNNIQNIDSYSFSNCKELTKVILNDSLKKIGWYSFAKCGNLRKIYIPSKVESIGAGPFYGCSRLEYILVSEKNSTYKSLDGNLFNKNGTTLTQYALGCKNKEYYVPGTVKNIASYSFYGARYLKNVYIVSLITVIGKFAFNNCDNLLKIITKDGIEKVDYGNFFECYKFTGIDGKVDMYES